MRVQEKIQDLRERMERNLREGILPFWRTYLPDDLNGGFYGRVDEERKPDPGSPKSVVLNCRLLWTFTRAWEIYGEEQDKILAQRAYEYIFRFWDDIYGGVYWMLTCRGEPSEMEKRTYGQGFLIYSMAEYYRAFGDCRALDLALRTLSFLDVHMKYENGGYADSSARDWRSDDWVNVWVKNRTGADKLLNSNMHLFEAILTLAEVSGDHVVLQDLRQQLVFLLDTAADRSLCHMKAGMSKDGMRLDGEINYGHDCECSYLLVRAAKLLRDDRLEKKAERVSDEMMKRVYQEGLDSRNGGIYYIADSVSGELNRSKIWWVQAEGITAFFDCYQRTGDENYLDAAVSIWNYVETCMINWEKGDWFSVGKDLFLEESVQTQENALSGVFTNGEMAGKGKCPYHNSRTCFEIMERADQLARIKKQEE